jgi:GNAT superfamily N-acetyltransferase
VNARISPYPLGDIELARRLERTEALANAAFVQGHAELDPASAAAWISVAGVYAMFDGVDSPLTQTFGMGVFEPVGETELGRLEAFFAERGAPVLHEVSPFIPADTLAALSDRGYRPIEFSNVLIRPTQVTPGPPGPVTAREIEDRERDHWPRVVAEGWRSESEGLAEFIEAFGRVMTRAEGVHCFFAEKEGKPIAAAALVLKGSVALLAGASTIPSSRRQGAQRVLLEHRLRFALERGAELAMVVAQPGSGSQRNAERQGFRVAYTRTKWELQDPRR